MNIYKELSLLFTLSSLLEDTLDGSDPTRYYTKNNGPSSVSGYADFCTAVIRSSGTSRVCKEKIRLNIAGLKSITLLQKPIFNLFLLI